MTMVKEIFNTMEYGPAPESADAAHEWLGRHKGRTELFIGGQVVAKDSRRLPSKLVDEGDLTRCGDLQCVAESSSLESLGESGGRLELEGV